MRTYLGLIACLCLYPFAASADTTGLSGYKLLVLAGHTVKWGKPSLGTGAAVTYAFINRHMTFSGVNCRGMDALAPVIAKSGIDEPRLHREVARAFDLWSHVADIRFSEALGTESADILIGAETVPVGWAYTNVDETAPGNDRDDGIARALGPNAHGSASIAPGGRTLDQTRAIRQSLICLNPAKSWKIGFDGNLDIYDLRFTVAHEIGHAIGLDHPGSIGAVMGYKYTEQLNQLTSGDISGVTQIYGLRRDDRH